VETAKKFGAARSGQLLIVAALAIAILIASTSIYVYELTTQKQSAENDSIVELVLAIKTGLRNAAVSALANITQGGQKTVLAENLDTLADVYTRLYPQQICQIRYKLPNSAGYEDGVKLSWNSNNGLGVSSVYVPYMLKVLAPTFNATLNDAVNITTTLKVQGFCTVGENETLKTVNLTCMVFNEEKQAQAKWIAIYYEDDSGAWIPVNNPSITDWGNSTYSPHFTVALASDFVHVSVHVVDARNILVVANTTCSQAV